MKTYFEIFDELLEKLSRNLNDHQEIGQEELDSILKKMDHLTASDPKLKPQQGNVAFYRKTIGSLFKEGVSSGYKTSAYGQLKREKQLLEEFSKAYGLF